MDVQQDANSSFPESGKNISFKSLSTLKEKLIQLVVDRDFEYF